MNNDKKKIGLALSGGGYRAAAYHVGTLRALHKLGILNKVDVISSVSGGSITTAYYALHKDDYEAFEQGLKVRLQRGVLWSSFLYVGVLGVFVLAFAVALGYITSLVMGALWPNHPIWAGSVATLVGVCALALALLAILKNSFTALPTSKFISKLYDKVFFERKTLSDLPETPLLCINSTNLATQLPFTFSRGMMGEHAYRINGQSIFDATNFPLSRAVMASSCVPYGFTPITIGAAFVRGKYDDCEQKPEPPKLIDGGVYDNQGAHKLSQDKSRFHCDYIVVSDAGNGKVNAMGTTHFFNLAMNTISMMMNRIKKMQRSDNLYEGVTEKEHFAYVPLEWDCSERLLQGFVNNLRNGNVHPDVWQAHGISEAEISALKTKGTPRTEAEATIMQHIKANVAWIKFEECAPSAESVDLTRHVGTSLVALSAAQIDALIAHSAWLAELQTRLYLPMLVEQG